MITTVAIPVSTGILRLHAEKGRQWSPIEHLVLYLLVREAKAARQLAVECCIPLRVAIEILIRLMRAGWVELREERPGIVFQATAAGVHMAGQEKLKAATRPVKRKAGFAYDQITGAAFRSRDLTLYSKGRLDELKKDSNILELQVDKIPPFRIQEVINRLLDEDEEFKSIEQSAERLVDKFAVVSVVGEAIEDLPSYAPAALRDHIIRAASAVTPARDTAATAVVRHQSSVPSSEGTLTISASSDDFIVGADNHRAFFESALRSARQRLIIHSTFINARTFSEFAPLLHDALKRDVQVDIFYGLDTEARVGRINEIQSTVAQCLSNFPPEIAARLTFHEETTTSHGKFLVYDNGRGEFFAAIGSCNWLNSDYRTFEVSFHCKDPQVVAALVTIAGDMDQGPSGHWTTFTREMATLAALLRKREGKRGPRATARLVFGAEHNLFVRQARDEARDQIVIASHRISAKARTQVIYPAEAATKDGGVDVVMYYGQVDEGGDAIVGANAGKGNIRFREIYEPKMHAKFLAWDRDSVVITSQNWLSADPAEAHPYSEIGLYLCGHGLARELIQATERNLGR